MQAFPISAALGGAALVAIMATAPAARADQLQTPGACQVGMRVTTSDGHSGTISRVDRAWSYCYVHEDDTGKDVGYLYSLLSSGGGGNAGGGAGALAAGAYECFADGQYTFMNISITGPGSYSAAGGPGRYSLQASGQIVFLTGSLRPYHGKLLVGGRIGINTNGDSFYATSCERKQ